MNWQPPPPPRPGQGPNPMSGSPHHAAGPQAVDQPNAKELDYYELLQVDRDAHPTIIRYAYRFLAAMYHPDNNETGNADKFRIISEAWRSLSDEGKRAAYDMTLSAKEQSKAATKEKETKSEFGRHSLPDVPKASMTWDEVELRLGVLQVLLAARKQKPKTGGASANVLMDCLNLTMISEIDFALWYLREKGFIEMGERVFMITAVGVDYLTDQLNKTQILGEQSTVEKKLDIAAGGANLPAVR